jgi:membrane protein implicated in regulation of membrane protease activity
MKKSKDKDQNQEILGKFEQFTHSLEYLIKLIFATPFFLTIFAVFAFILGSIFMFLLDFAFPQAFEDVWLELTFMFGLSFLAIIGIAVYSGKNSTPPNDTNDRNDN